MAHNIVERMKQKYSRAKVMTKKNNVGQIPLAVPDILTREFVASKLCFIFDDAIVLDSKFNMVAVNGDTAKLFRNTSSDLTGKSLNCLSDKSDLVADISQLLKNGYFRGESFELKNAHGKIMKVKLSGIYLGLISDFNEFIILTVKDLSLTHRLTKKLKTKEAILENLVYRASHDLRGPIATILGLVNLAKRRTDNGEIDKLFELIDSHSKLLDHRLGTLVRKAAAKELKVDSHF